MRIWAGRRRMLVVVIVNLVLWAITPAVPPVHAAPPWLDYVNSIRANANLPPVTENTTWDAGDYAHSQYMVINNFIGHAETPGMPGYSDAGNTAAMNGNVTVNAGGTSYTYQNAIDSWMTGPFHALGIIDPKLAQTGFGIYTDFTRPYPNFNGGATLDVLRGRTATPTYPVFFPGNGKQMPYMSYDGTESPDPLSGCAGYTAPTGPPLMLLFAATPALNSVALTRDGTGALATCAFTELTYTNPNGSDQSLGRNVLAGRHAVIVMPQLPFTNGTYHLTVNNGGAVYTITFGVGMSVLPTLQSITLTPANGNVMFGSTQQFTATGVYSDGSTQNLTGTVTWASSAPGIATITAGGLATAVTSGITTITATSGAITASATLSVTVPSQPGRRTTGTVGGAPNPIPGGHTGGTSGGNPIPQPTRH